MTMVSGRGGLVRLVAGTQPARTLYALAGEVLAQRLRGERGGAGRLPDPQIKKPPGKPGGFFSVHQPKQSFKRQAYSVS